jgi:hypothetical protein
MATVYPSQIDSPVTLSTAVDNSTPVDAASVNQLRDAIVAIETELGVDPGTNFTTVRNRLDTYEMLINQILSGGGGGSFVNFGGDLAGTNVSQTVVGIQKRPVSSNAPTPGQALIWSGLLWAPTTIPPGFTAGGDLSGTNTSQTVIGIQNHPVPAPTGTNTVLSWSGSVFSWVSSVPPTGTAGGDLSGTYPNPTVAKIDGASVPAAGSLITGNVLQVSGASSLTYAAVNLAGGSNYVTGILPAGNQAAQTMGGDVTGTTASNTVVSITGSGGIVSVAASVGGSTTASAPFHFNYAVITLTSDADYTLTAANYVNPILQISSSVSLTATRNIIGPSTTGARFSIFNNTTGGQSIIFKASTGTGVTIPNGVRAVVHFNGTNYVAETVIPATDLSGTNTSQTVVGIRGNPVPSPTGTNTFLEWTGSVFTWGSATSVTWGSDLVNSTNTNQYVSSLSYNNTAGGGTITINGTSTVLQWASNTVPLFNQATLAGTGSNAGQTMTFQAQAGQNVSSGTNNNGGNLVLKSGAVGTGGTGGTSGSVLVNTDGTTQVTVAPALTTIANAASFSSTVAITGNLTLSAALLWAIGSAPQQGYVAITLTSDANFTPSSSQYNASTLAFTSSVSLTATRNIVLPLTQGARWIVYNNTTGAQSLQVIGSSGSGFTVANGSSALVWTDGTNFYGVSGGGGGGSVTWANDLVNSTNTNQYVSSLSYNSSAAGGTITINGTSTVLQWASNTTPVFNQATLAGTGANNGKTFTVQAQAGQNVSSGTNNSGGNLVLAGGAAGTGGTGGSAGDVVIQNGATVVATLNATDIDSDGFAEVIEIGSSISNPRFYQITQSGTGANAGFNFQINAQAGQNVSSGTNNNGGNLILAGGAAGTGGTGGSAGDVIIQNGSVVVATLNATDIDADGFAEVMEIGATIVAPRLYQVTQSGTGANAGYNLKINAQAGQNVSSGTNNNGGNLILASGAVGTGGTGGTAGNVLINTDGTTQITVSPTSTTLTGSLLWATNSAPALGYTAVSLTSDANFTLTGSQYNATELAFTSTVSLTTTRNIVVPLTQGARWIVYNNTTGSQSLQFIGSSGTGITVANGNSAEIWTDGTNVYKTSHLVSVAITGGSPTTGEVLTASGPSTASWQPVGSATNRFTATDANTSLEWTLDETTSPWANHGTAGTLNMTDVLGTVNANITGLFGQCIDFPNSAALATSATSVGESSIFTMSVWVYLIGYTSNGCIVSKAYAPSPTWSSPYVSCDMSVNTSLDGAWTASLTVSGTRYFTGGTAGNYGIPLLQWTLLTSTYDGTTFRSYINGTLSESTSVTGVVDYGTHGPWMIGGIQAISGSYLNGRVDEFRFESTVRSQSYIENMYKQGVGLLDTSQFFGPYTTRLTPIDSSTAIYWTLDETSSPWANTGTGGTLNQATSYSTPAEGQTGIFGNCLDFGGTSGIISADTSIGESGTSQTVSCWVYLHSFVSSGEIIDKKYQTSSTWSSPYTAWAMYTSGAADGTWTAEVTVSGTRYTVTCSGEYGIQSYQWNLIALTYDGSNLRAYINGNLAGTTSISGTIDYGSHGAYQIGAVTVLSTQGTNGKVDDVRIETTVRSQAYLQAMYKDGIGLFDTLLGSVQAGANYGKYLDVLPFPGITTTNSTTFVTAGTFEFDPTIITAANGTRTIVLRAIAHTTSPQVTIQLYNLTAAAVVTGSTLTTTSTTPTLLTTTGDLTSNLTNGPAIYQVQIEMASGLSTDQITLDMAKLRITWS